MSLPHFIRSKIVCTIGPASSSPSTLRKMKEHGMDVARINMSHGEPEDNREIFESIREMGDVSILVDLPGPKIRLGELDGRFTLQDGETVRFTTRDVVGSRNLLPVTYDKLPGEVYVGGHVFINDGIIDLEVTEIDTDKEGFTAKVIAGGDVSSRKGVNAPGATLSMRPPTAKDLKGIKFGVEMDCDWFAASFVRDAGDIEAVRKAIRDLGGDQPIISKIEHADAIRNIGEIIEASDGVMVARGDLGIEIEPWDIPLLQKKIISACNQTGKPVIVATQMLESMINNPRPTRAEASDVANALLDGADAVMLSGETAVGKYPVGTVAAMNSISLVVQEQIRHQDGRHGKGVPVTDVIGQLATRGVDAVETSAVFVVTRSGISARMVSKYRPRSKILAVVKDPRISRRMLMYWGVEPLEVEWTEDRDALILRAVYAGLEKQYIHPKSVIAVVSGSTMIAPGKTTTLSLLNVEDILSRAENRG